MKNKHQRFGPLMYIEQRSERISRPAMQHTYSSLYKKPSQEVTPSDSKQKGSSQRKRKRSVRRQIHAEPTTMGEEKVEVEEGETEIKAGGTDTPFAELSIEEKVIYCTSTSNYIPNIQCMIQTKERTVVGTIANFEDGIVHIRPQRSRAFVEIPIEDLISIRMTGF